MKNDKDRAVTMKNLQALLHENDKDFLTLSLSLSLSRGPLTSQPPPPPPASPSPAPHPAPPPSPPPSPSLSPPQLPEQSPLPYLTPHYEIFLWRTQQLFLRGNPNPNPNPNPNMMAPAVNPVPEKEAEHGPVRRVCRMRRSKTASALRPGKPEIIEAPFPWAANRRATVLSLPELAQIEIEMVTGEMECSRCDVRFTLGFDVKAEFRKLAEFIIARKDSFKDRSPEEWDSPVVPVCESCGQMGSTRPVFGLKKRDINWVFLLLGRFLSFCSLGQLKYFCKHTGNHRTGAKNRLLYLTYFGICKQLDPSGPFDALG